MKNVSIGLKSNADILLQTAGSVVVKVRNGGTYHRAIIEVLECDIPTVKEAIKSLGFSPQKSMTVCGQDVNYSVLLRR